MPFRSRPESIGRSLTRRAEEAGLGLSANLRLALSFVLFVSASVLITSRYPVGGSMTYQVGDVAKTDVVTPVELTVDDPERTARLREEEATRIPQVFIYYPARQEEVVTKLREDLSASRKQFIADLETALGSATLTDQRLGSPAFRRVLQSAHGPRYPFPVKASVGRTWAQGKPADDIEAPLIAAIRSVMGRYIRPEDTPPSLHAATAQPVRLLPPVFLEEPSTLNGTDAYPVIRFGDLSPLGEARALLRRTLSTGEPAGYADYLEGLVGPNAVFSPELTSEVRAQQTQHINATTHYEPRQFIARRGEQITPRALAAITKLNSYRLRDRRLTRMLGLLLLVSAFYFALWRFANRIKVFSLTTLKVFFLAGLAATGQLLVVRVGTEIAALVAHRFGDYDTPQGYQFAIPYGASALMLALLLENRIALVAALLISMMTLLMGDNPSLVTYGAISSIVAIFSVARYQRRDTITRASLIVGLANLAVTLVLALVSLQPLTLGPVLFNAGAGLAGGLLTGAVAAFALPIIESTFGIVTDVKLLELSNAELPLLKRLAIESPGTYQHSLIVATLAEAAAKAVGANSLLVRIGCYYHDIGKLADPQMYVENQRRSFNPHELLTPQESVRTIARHVSEGIRLGREAGLPQPIIDLIPQHHGTRRLEYFCAKAQKLAEQTGELIREVDFRYPGPKPQSIEAALVMLADSAEAATRSLRELSPENVARMLRKIIDTVVTDGQLDECNLRMHDLQIIKQGFQDTLLSIHHQRIQYPGFTEKDLDTAERDYEALPANEISASFPARTSPVSPRDDH